VTTKLHINISQGVIDIEGDPELVREIYNDFRDQLLNDAGPAAPALSANEQAADESPSKAKARRRPARRKRVNNGSDEADPTVIANSPKLDKHLDISALPGFYSGFETKNNPEKILVFVKFLIEELGIESPNTDQIYTCYERVHERVPKVFSQAFRDASGRKFGYIDYNSPTDIRLTTVGNNHFKFDLKKKAAE
jgi:hypothetical protein